MFGYGALLNNSFGEGLENAWNNFINLLDGVPLYGYVIALALLIILIKLLIKK
jgi:hypothetical protein